MSILKNFHHKQQDNHNDKVYNENTNETLGQTLKSNEEDIDNVQTTTKTSTVNKKVVIGLFVFFMTVITTVFIFSTDSSEDKKQEKKQLNIVNTEENYNSTKTSNMDKIPGNYDSLAKHEQQPQVNKNANNQSQTQYVPKREPTNLNNNTNYYPENNNEVHYSRPVPMLQNQPPSYPSKQQTSNTANNTSINSSNTNNEQKQDEKNIFAAAIKFMSFNQDADTKEIVTTESPTNNTFSYPQVNNINENTILAGTLINATLLSGINNQIGGQIMAQINNNIYDSLYGNNLLIPAGSKIIGQYESTIKQGQSRVDISWNTLIFPNGDTYNVENMFKSVDSQGYAGIKGDVNNHTGKQIGAGVLASAIGALGNIATGNNYSEYGWRNSGDLAAQGAATSLINTASKLFEKQMNIEPEITINPGTLINLMATTNLVF